LKDGINTCYVEMALKAHNIKRAKHKGGKPYEKYDNASKAIQKEMEKAGFGGTIPNRPSAFNDCSENIFE
jgi:hypothetical protein